MSRSEIDFIAIFNIVYANSPINRSVAPPSHPHLLRNSSRVYKNIFPILFMDFLILIITFSTTLLKIFCEFFFLDF